MLELWTKIPGTYEFDWTIIIYPKVKERENYISLFSFSISLFIIMSTSNFLWPKSTHVKMAVKNQFCYIQQKFSSTKKDILKSKYQAVF